MSADNAGLIAEARSVVKWAGESSWVGEVVTSLADALEQAEKVVTAALVFHAVERQGNIIDDRRGRDEGAEFDAAIEAYRCAVGLYGVAAADRLRAGEGDQ